MASFGKSNEENVPAAFKDFLISIPTAHWHVDAGVEHVHTTPQWESAPQYLVVIPVECPVEELKGRWLSHKIDTNTQQRCSFYLEDIALCRLKGIIETRLGHLHAKRKHRFSCGECLARLEKVKETHTETFRSCANMYKINIPLWISNCRRCCTSRVLIPSSTEVPEDVDGRKIVPQKRRKVHWENKPLGTPSNRSRR